MLVSNIQAEHRKELEKQEKEFNDAEQRMYENEKLLKFEADNLKKTKD